MVVPVMSFWSVTEKMNLEIKGKVCRTVVRPAMVYEAETWALKKAQEKRL